MLVDEVPTPALVIDANAIEHNVSKMAAQAAAGYCAFTCATPRAVIGMTRAGLGDDLLLANETVDPPRPRAIAALDAAVTVAIDSDAILDAASAAGIRRVLIDVNVGLPRCGVAPDAGALADRARAAGLEVRGVMGYEGV